MFKHILLPVDGTELSLRAVRLATRLAVDCQARITLLHVVRPLHVHAYLADMLAAAALDYTTEAEQQAWRYLETASALVQEAGVACDSVISSHECVSDGVLDTAKQEDCDLIAMASHGRQGINRLLLGSETHDVIVKSEIPVLVCR